MSDLTGKYALVTGGGTGIGAVIATTLAQAGAKVTISGRRADVLQLHADSHKNIDAIIGDVCNVDSIENVFSQAQQNSGAIDIVVANAGAAKSASFSATDQDLWDQMLTVNLTGTFLTLKTAYKYMTENSWGRMISVASTAGQKGYAFTSAYCAAKHGVVGLTRSLAIELAQTGITVNALCPGFTQTDLLEDSLKNIQSETGLNDERARSALTKFSPIGRFINPEEVATAALWLCSEGSDAITGQAISISGGETW